MASNSVFFAWNRPAIGREEASTAHFQEFTHHLTEQQKKEDISSFSQVFLDPHGGNLNGYFLIQGESTKLDNLISSEAWVQHTTQASLNLEGFGVIRGAGGEMLKERMAIWMNLLPNA